MTGVVLFWTVTGKFARGGSGDSPKFRLDPTPTQHQKGAESLSWGPE